VVSVEADDPSVIERVAMTPDDRLLLTPTEAARRLSIGRTLCYELLRRGELVSITIGARRCIPVAALDAYIQARLASEGFASVQGYGA
jgi:excisionase family DNA binding protein